ncbi:hypothetical protein HK096_010753 [Nowakowskiella sp. JEL0078]|nr:hypothetical protein HK096_010753 [Nowakowskiella sp. JEL0078]
MGTKKMVEKKSDMNAISRLKNQDFTKIGSDFSNKDQFPSRYFQFLPTFDHFQSLSELIPEKSYVSIMTYFKYLSNIDTSPYFQIEKLPLSEILDKTVLKTSSKNFKITLLNRLIMAKMPGINILSRNITRSLLFERIFEVLIDPLKLHFGHIKNQLHPSTFETTEEKNLILKYQALKAYVWASSIFPKIFHDLEYALSLMQSIRVEIIQILSSVPKIGLKKKILAGNKELMKNKCQIESDNGIISELLKHEGMSLIPKDDFDLFERFTKKPVKLSTAQLTVLPEVKKENEPGLAELWSKISDFLLDSEIPQNGVRNLRFLTDDNEPMSLVEVMQMELKRKTNLLPLAWRQVQTKLLKGNQKNKNDDDDLQDEELESNKIKFDRIRKMKKQNDQKSGYMGYNNRLASPGNYGGYRSPTSRTPPGASVSINSSGLQRKNPIQISTINLRNSILNTSNDSSENIAESYISLVNSFQLSTNGMNFIFMRDLEPGFSTNVAFYAIIASFESPKKTRGSDYCCHVSLVDPTKPNQTFSMLIFRSTIQQFPPISRNGEVQEFGSKLQIVAGKMAQCQIIPTDINQNSLASTVGLRFTGEDKKIANFLTSWWQHTQSNNDKNFGINNSLARNSTTFSRRPVLEINNIMESKYFDIYALLIEVQSLSLLNCTLILTDFTSNMCLPESLELSQTENIYEKHTLLKCTLWDEYVERGNSLTPGSVIFFRNARLKVDNFGFYEMTVNRDQQYPMKNHIQVIEADHPSAIKLLRRDQRLKKILGPPTRVDISGDSVDVNISQILRCSIVPDRFVCRGVQVVSVTPVDRRDFVRAICSHCNSSILPNPEDTIATCLTCDTLVDFAKPTMKKQPNVEHWKDSEVTKAPSHFEFRFSIRISDGTATLPLIVSGKEAQLLLGSLEPTDLYRNQNSLKDLETLLSRIIPPQTNYADQPPPRVPEFDCGIISYEVSKWDGNIHDNSKKCLKVRRFKIAGTIILSGDES